MTPEVRFSTHEIGRDAAHRLVDAAYDAVAEPITPTAADRDVARAMVEVSSSPAYVALLGALEGGSATIGGVSKSIGKTEHGVRTALGRAVGDWSRFPWKWSGSGSSERVEISPELAEAIRAERAGEQAVARLGGDD